MIKPKKTYELHDRQSSYLLLINQDFIITNNNYAEVILLTHELEFVRTIQFPQKKFICHYSYANTTLDHFLLDGSDSNTLALVDLSNLKISLIENNVLETIIISPSYLWVESDFIALARFTQNLQHIILQINTSNKQLSIISFEDRFDKTPQFAQYLDIEAKHKAWPIHCNQDYMVLGNFSETSTVDIIDLHGITVRAASIKKELQEELVRLSKRSSAAHELAERFPHNIEYQDGWILLIWEGKVVVIDPADQRTTVLMGESGNLKAIKNGLKKKS